jgi:hypothetical protein
MTASLEGGEWSAPRPGPHFTPGKEPVPIVLEAGWAFDPVWRDAGSLVPSSRSQDRPVRSESLWEDKYTRGYGGKTGKCPISGHGWRMRLKRILNSVGAREMSG